MSPANVQRSISGLRVKVEIHPGQVKSSSTQSFFLNLLMIILKNLIYIIVLIFLYVYIALIQLWKPTQNAVMWNLGDDNKRNSKSIAAAQRPQFYVGSDN